MKIDDVVKVLDKASAEVKAVKEEKQAEENYLLDSWTQGFVKACADRGVDANELVDLLLSADSK